MGRNIGEARSVTDDCGITVVSGLREQDEISTYYQCLDTYYKTKF